jgi:hypothetical protein
MFATNVLKNATIAQKTVRIFLAWNHVFVSVMIVLTRVISVRMIVSQILQSECNQYRLVLRHAKLVLRNVKSTTMRLAKVAPKLAVHALKNAESWQRK